MVRMMLMPLSGPRSWIRPSPMTETETCRTGSSDRACLGRRCPDPHGRRRLRGGTALRGLDLRRRWRPANARSRWTRFAASAAPCCKRPGRPWSLAPRRRTSSCAEHVPQIVRLALGLSPVLSEGAFSQSFFSAVADRRQAATAGWLRSWPRPGPVRVPVRLRASSSPPRRLYVLWRGGPRSPGSAICRDLSANCCCMCTAARLCDSASRLTICATR